MNVSVRLFLGYFLMLGLAAWFVLNIFTHEAEPGIRQATEETLVDTAHVLAELAAPEVVAGQLADGRFARALAAARGRSPQASIWGVRKDSIDFRVYVTDQRGRVIFDSAGLAQGEDYAQWRDVARVLKGEYGARSTRAQADDATSSVMYVAAPILHDGQLIGVLSLAKPLSSVMPYIGHAEQRVKRAGYILLAASALIGVAFSAWLSWSINRLRTYARDVSEGRKADPPTSGGRQFSELARALALMRERLEGKQYVERYVQNLAHEMKSPLSAIVGAAEILEGKPADDDRRRFAASVGEQARRLQTIIERLLMLARVEQLQAPEEMRRVDLGELLRRCVGERSMALQARDLRCGLAIDAPLAVRGDPFLLQQALLNLLDNAIAFSPAGGNIEIALHRREQQAEVAVRDHGSGAPEYALAQVFDRFYSLPRTATGKKSSGLGLPLVREVARLHAGDADFANHPEGGALARLVLPLA
ncbi:two-component system sensor histidine kinase CreC [Accumulibacter sp.]|uniref:two-component system sensor histidine kinase CreC n=1 Tax=Accumulibacter sp. TaxID=2053492 RepID=UPI00260B323F|nr:two-component system sensor histidine kinase CreC [Accumulibacter sp.]